MSNFINTKIIKTSLEGPLENHKWQYELMFPPHIATVSESNPKGWDVWDYWERERIESMQKHLKFGDVLFDVGAESGAMSALFAKYMVGAENMVLFEPSGKFWPLIRSIWKENGLVDPRACRCSFVGAKSSKYSVQGFDGIWPAESIGEVIQEGMPYAYIHNEGDNTRIPTYTIDTFVVETGIVPTALTIDVEGAEMAVLEGAAELITKHRPLLWVSVHPDLMLKNYGVSDAGLLMWMKKMKYNAELLATDHEKHFLFTPVKA